MNNDAVPDSLKGRETRDFRSTETRVATRAILRQLQSRRPAAQKLNHSKLNQKEVGDFLAEHAKIMFLAASAANLPRLEKKAELFFYEACLIAEGLL